MKTFSIFNSQFSILLVAAAVVFAGCEKEKDEEPAVASGTTGECIWALTGATGSYTLTISGTGAMADYEITYINYVPHSTAPWDTYREDIKTAVIQEGVTTIGDAAFFGCTGLESLTIGNSVKTIGESAFYYCSGLTGALTIPNSVETIGDAAFSSCDGLESLTIGNSVTTIGERTFSDCSGLTSVTIGNSVETIDNLAFQNCTGLTTISVDESNQNYSSSDGVLFNKDKTTLMQFPGGKTGSYTIPNSVTTIGERAFSGCSGLTSVTIPESVITIGDGAFYNCTGLTTVTIPESVETIGERAFYNCTGLTTVTIPESVITIGDGAFYNCTGLTTVTNQRTTPQSIKSDTFTNVNNITLKVPASAVSAYESADVWKDFKEIVGI